MIKLKVFRTIDSKDRISSVDIFRCLAILAVVAYHFNARLPYGYLGVDLFFVISGLLVGGLLTRQFASGEKINIFKFLMQRGFKIWPSYYAFLLFGSLIAYFFYHRTNPGQIIPFDDLKRYIFFYQNYKGIPFHWSFDHIWSLCVEEHFYILLPLLFLFVQAFIPQKLKLRALFIFVILSIFAGIVLKNISFYFTNSKDTYSSTHNRIDALAWGVLLNLLITYYGEKIKSARYAFIYFLAGLALFVLSLFISIQYNNAVFNKIYFPSITPIAFSLMLLGLYYVDFSRFKILRFIAYYSYNWYLWHPVFVIFLTGLFGDTVLGLMVYIPITFFMAMITTIFIEEQFLSKKKALLGKLFKRKKKSSPVVAPFILPPLPRVQKNFHSK